MGIDQFKLNEEYPYPKIEAFIEEMDSENDGHYDLEFGQEICGENFIVLNYGAFKASFVLTGSSGGVFIYKCIFNE